MGEIPKNDPSGVLSLVCDDAGQARASRSFRFSGLRHRSRLVRQPVEAAQDLLHSGVWQAFHYVAISPAHGLARD